MKRESIKGLAVLLLCVLCLPLSLTGCGGNAASVESAQNAPEGMELGSADEQAVILELTDRHLTLAPANYDEDNAGAFDDEIKELALSDKVIIWNLDIQTAADEDGTESSEQTWSKLTLEEVRALLDYGPVSVYCWYDDAGSVQKLLVWGETVVWK